MLCPTLGFHHNPSFIVILAYFQTVDLVFCFFYHVQSVCFGSIFVYSVFAHGNHSLFTIVHCVDSNHKYQRYSFFVPRKSFICFVYCPQVQERDIWTCEKAVRGGWQCEWGMVIDKFVFHECEIPAGLFINCWLLLKYSFLFI